MLRSRAGLGWEVGFRLHRSALRFRWGDSALPVTLGQKWYFPHLLLRNRGLLSGLTARRRLSLSPYFTPKVCFPNRSAWAVCETLVLKLSPPELSLPAHTAVYLG